MSTPSPTNDISGIDPDSLSRLEVDDQVKFRWVRAAPAYLRLSLASDLSQSSVRPADQ